MAPTTTSTPATGNGAVRHRPPSTSSGPATTTRLAARNRTRIIAGVLVMVVSALTAGLLYANLGHRQPVLAVARDVAAGQVIRDADLKQVLVPEVEGVHTIAARERASTVGRTAAVRLVAGSLLSPEQITTGAGIDPASAVVGAVLKAGQYPIGLRAGDKVLAVAMPSDAEVAAGTDASPAQISATVVAIEETSSVDRDLSISLAVNPADAAVLAVAGAKSRIALVLAPR